MRISLFLPTLNGGGIQKATIRLIRELLKRDVQVVLVAINGNGPIRKEIPEGCDFIDLKASRTRYAFIPLLKYLRSAKTIIGISSQTHLNVLMIIIRVLTGYPKYLVVREHNTFNSNYLKANKFVENLRPQLIRLFYPMATKLIAVSRSVAESIHQHARVKKEIQVIQNGIDVDEIQTLIKSLPDQPWYPKISDKKTIVGLGRLSNQKNFSSLLTAFSLLNDVENLQLVIMGEGEEHHDLLSLSKKLDIHKRVLLPGFVVNPYPILSQAKIFVLSSRWEGFSNVILEALACGVPIVATDCPGGPADILADKPFARVVPMNDPVAMASAMREILSLTFEKNEIIRYARQFDITKIAQQYIELVNDIEKNDS